MSRTVVTGKTFATDPDILGNATFSGVGGLTIPIGSTAERPVTPSEGVIRYNATTGKFEGYSKDPNDITQTLWGSLGGGALLDLSDIDESGLVNGNLLKWDSVLTKFVPTAGGAIDNILVSGQPNLTIPATGDLEFVSGAGIQLTTDPSNGKLTIASTTQANLSVDLFTGDGSTNEFILTRVPPSPTDILVFVDSLYQAPSSYTIVGTNPAKLVFPENVPNLLDITVTFLNLDTIQTVVQDGSITPAKLSASTYYIDTFYGDASTKTFTLSQLASTPNQLLVIINGVLQEPGADNAYSVTGTQITFTTAPSYNALIKVRFLGATFNTASSISPDAVGIPEMDIGGSGTTGQVLGLGSSGGLIWISPASADFIYNNQTFTNATSIEFNIASGFTLTEGNPGVLTVGFGDYLTTVSVTGQPTISIDSTRELEFIAGPGVGITTDNTVDDKKVTWSVSVGAITEDILPATTSTYDLGSSSNVWDTVHTNTVDLGNITLSEIIGALSIPHSLKFGGSYPIVLTATANGLELEKLTIGTPAQVLASEHVTLTATTGKLNLPAENIGLPELDISNSGTAGQYLSTTGSALQWTTGLTAVTAGTGLLLQGGGTTITSTGTLIVDPQISQDALQGVVAYGWGDHTSIGYLTDLTTENLTSLTDVNTGTLGIVHDGWALVWNYSTSKFIVANTTGNWLSGTVSGSIYYGGGRVGIGTSTPVGLLHISQQESSPSDPLIIQDGAYRPLYIPAGGMLTSQTGIHLETDYASLNSPTAPTTGGILYFKNGLLHFVSSTSPEQIIITGAETALPNVTSIGTTASLKLPTGTTAQRGPTIQGGIRYSTELATFEGYDGSNWGSLGGIIDVDQDTYITAEATTDSDDLDFWTAGTKRMTIDQTGAVTITGTDALVLPAGTDAQRNTAIQGGFRYNTDTPGFEGYDGTEWGEIGGSASALITETTTMLRGPYAETMLFSDAFIVGGDITLTDNLFLAKLGEDGTDITLTDDGNSRTITGQGTIVPGALFDSSFAIATTAQPNITQIGTTASIKVPTGTTAQRGTPLAGGIRYNTTLGSFEGYSGSAWGSLGGLIDIDQDTYITAEATADSDDLDFWTAGTKRMTIDQTGAVSITGSVSGGFITTIQNTHASDAPVVTILSGQTGGTNRILSLSNGAGPVAIVTTSGNVGIGATDPSSPLHLKTTGSTDVNMVLEGPNSTWSIGNDYSDGGYLKFSNNATVGTSTAMTFGANGNIGIGTTTPGTYKLYVNGDIYCDDISTSDIKMCNDRPNHPGNEIDGTKGSWTFQEGSENMYLINRKSGKRYKLKLEEV